MNYQEIYAQAQAISEGLNKIQDMNGGLIALSEVRYGSRDAYAPERLFQDMKNIQELVLKRVSAIIELGERSWELLRAAEDRLPNDLMRWIRDIMGIAKLIDDTMGSPIEMELWIDINDTVESYGRFVTALGVIEGPLGEVLTGKTSKLTIDRKSDLQRIRFQFERDLPVLAKLAQSEFDSPPPRPETPTQNAHG